MKIDFLLLIINRKNTENPQVTAYQKIVCFQKEVSFNKITYKIRLNCCKNI